MKKVIEFYEKKKETDPLISKEVGNLTILEKTEMLDRGYPVYKCSCACGRTAYLSTVALFQKGWRTCGCGMSKEVAILWRALKSTGLVVKRKKKMPGCLNEDGYTYKCDLALHYASEPDAWVYIDYAPALEQRERKSKSPLLYIALTKSNLKELEKSSGKDVLKILSFLLGKSLV